MTAGSTLVSKPLRSRLEPTSTSPSSVVSITVETCSPALGGRDRGEVAAVDHLVADVEPPAQPDELALARLEREVRARRSRASSALQGPAARTTSSARSSAEILAPGCASGR